MKNRYALSLFMSLNVIAVSVCAQNVDGLSSTWNQRVEFLTPLDLKLSLPNGAPIRRKSCSNVPRLQCPQRLISGGNSQGGLPTLDPVFTAKAPHVRVSFVLQRFKVVGASAQYLEPNGLSFDAWWTTSSTVADEETGNFQIYFDGPAEVDGEGYFFSPPVIYEALVLNACDSFASFPVSHEADFDAVGATTIPFSGLDATTIDSTGFYNFSYTVAVDGDDIPPAESGLQMSGKVNVTCTAASSL